MIGTMVIRFIRKSNLSSPAGSVGEGEFGGSYSIGSFNSH